MPNFPRLLMYGFTENGEAVPLRVDEDGKLELAELPSVTAEAGPELLTNPGFTGSATGWTLGTGWSYGGNAVTHADGAAGDLTQTFVTVPGQLYQITITVAAGNEGGEVTVFIGGVEAGSFGDSSGPFTFYAIATDDTGVLLAAEEDYAGTITSVSLKAVSPSRLLELIGVAGSVLVDGSGLLTITGEVNLLDTVFNNDEDALNIVPQWNEAFYVRIASNLVATGSATARGGIWSDFRSAGTGSQTTAHILSGSFSVDDAFDTESAFVNYLTAVLNGTSVTDALTMNYQALFVNDTAEATEVFGTYFVAARESGAEIGDLYAIWIADLQGIVTTAGHSASAFWYDGFGGNSAVFRINELGIPSLYNWNFGTDYTPGETNFERWVLQWGITGTLGTTDRALFGVEAGGTGTLRGLDLMAADIRAVGADGSTFVKLRGQLQTHANATTGLSAGALAATTNASIVLYDGSGQAYRVPCII